MPEQRPTSEQSPERTTTQVPRLIVTWLVVTVPLAYGLFQTVRSVVPLFTG